MEHTYEQEIAYIIHRAPPLEAQNCPFVLLGPDSARIGTLINVSLGGLMFEYVTMKAPSDEATELEILVPNGEFRLDRVPCQVIWDTATSQFPETPLHKRRCGVQFGELTQTQIAQLEDLIQNYAVGEV